MLGGDSTVLVNSGIYAIRNLVSGKIYIGSAVDFQSRWSVHLAGLRHGKHDNSYLQRAWDKYGPDAFVFEILEVIVDVTTLVAVEQQYLDDLKSYLPDCGYNICSTAGSRLGVSHSSETLTKMSAAAVGRKFSPETLAKMSEAKKGKKQTAEYVAKRVEGYKKNRALKPTKVCIVCGQGKIRCKDRCNACYLYFCKNGYDREMLKQIQTGE